MAPRHTVAVVFLTLLVAAAGIAAARETVYPSTAENQGQRCGKQTYAQDDTIEEVVITATRIETPTSEVGSSVTVISRAQIEEQQKSTVPDVLGTVPGLDVVKRQGATSVFMRGAKSEHTLVLLDGIEMNDPISPGRAFDFSYLTVDNIERIEVIRGPQSTLYGSDAMGGVINIITRKGQGSTGGFVSAEAGSYNTFREKAGLSGENSLVNYSLGISRLDTHGISAASRDDGNREDDGLENTSVSARIGLTLGDGFDLDVVLRWIDAEADIDNSGGEGGDDPNYTTDSEQLFVRTQGRLVLFDDLWEQKLGVSLSDYSRDGSNDTDADHPDDLSRDSYDGKIVKLDWQHNLYLHETNTVTLGLETEEEEGKSDYYSEGVWGPYSSTFDKETARTTGYYLQDQIRLWDSLFTTLGIRVDDHSKFGTQTNYRLTTAYHLRQTGTTIKGSYGTGFKAPTLYQLYSVYGDETLDPEESTGWDAGVEQSVFGGTMTLGATYFNNDFDDLIDYDTGLWRYVNIAQARSRGIELFATLRPGDDLTLRAAYTYTDSEDKTTGEELLLRAKNKFGLNVNYRFGQKANVNVDISHVGQRYDNDYSTWPATRVKLKAYTLVDLAVSYDVTGNIQLFSRVENLFDEEYEEVNGYGTTGISAYGGIKMTF